MTRAQVALLRTFRPRTRDKDVECELEDAMTAHRSSPTIQMLVCGDAERGDDGLAVAAVATLLPTLPTELLARIEVRRYTELRAEDLVAVPEDRACLIVDAIAGDIPGHVTRSPLSELANGPKLLPPTMNRSPIHVIVGLAEILRGQPVRGTFLGLGGQVFAFGAPLSRAARRALPAFRAAIEAELGRLAAGEPALRPSPTAD